MLAMLDTIIAEERSRRLWTALLALMDITNLEHLASSLRVAIPDAGKQLTHMAQLAATIAKLVLSMQAAHMITASQLLDALRLAGGQSTAPTAIKRPAHSSSIWGVLTTIARSAMAASSWTQELVASQRQRRLHIRLLRRRHILRQLQSSRRGSAGLPAANGEGAKQG
jgi:hypothetical protein